MYHNNICITSLLYSFIRLIKILLLSLSNADIDSSNNNILDFLNNARHILIFYFSHPDKTLLSVIFIPNII